MSAKTIAPRITFETTEDRHAAIRVLAAQYGTTIGALMEEAAECLAQKYGATLPPLPEEDRAKRRWGRRGTMMTQGAAKAG
jgi:NAD(P)H-hydrate repair Nnr-like enzyme with NAD(P)H-hydrate epimerase domain